MSDVKRLLDEASPLPWGVEWPQKERATLAYIIRERETGPQVANALLAEDAELIAHAVNRLPDYQRLADLADEVVTANGSDHPLREHRLDSAIRQLQIGLSALRGDA